MFHLMEIHAVGKSKRSLRLETWYCEGLSFANQPLMFPAQFPSPLTWFISVVHTSRMWWFGNQLMALSAAPVQIASA